MQGRAGPSTPSLNGHRGPQKKYCRLQEQGLLPSNLIQGTEMATMTSVLQHDHDALDALLAGCHSLALARCYEEARVRLIAFIARLSSHVLLEEELLSPAVVRAAAFSVQTMKAMAHEHSLMRTNLVGLRMSLARRLDHSTEELEQLRQLLRAHALSEERMLYPVAEQVVGDDVQAAIIAALESRHASS